MHVGTKEICTVDEGRLLVNDPGNPRVKKLRPVPLPVQTRTRTHTHTHTSRVQIYVGGGRGTQKPGGQHNPWLG